MRARCSALLPALYPFGLAAVAAAIHPESTAAAAEPLETPSQLDCIARARAAVPVAAAAVIARRAVSGVESTPDAGGHRAAASPSDPTRAAQQALTPTSASVVAAEAVGRTGAAAQRPPSDRPLTAQHMRRKQQPPPPQRVHRGAVRSMAAPATALEPAPRDGARPASAAAQPAPRAAAVVPTAPSLRRAADASDSAAAGPLAKRPLSHDGHDYGAVAQGRCAAAAVTVQPREVVAEPDDGDWATATGLGADATGRRQVHGERGARRESGGDSSQRAAAARATHAGTARASRRLDEALRAASSAAPAGGQARGLPGAAGSERGAAPAHASDPLGTLHGFMHGTSLPRRPRPTASGVDAPMGAAAGVGDDADVRRVLSQDPGAALLLQSVSEVRGARTRSSLRAAPRVTGSARAGG